MNLFIIWIFFLVVWGILISVGVRRGQVMRRGRRTDGQRNQYSISSKDSESIETARRNEVKDRNKLRSEMKDSGLVSKDEYDLTDL